MFVKSQDGAVVLNNDKVTEYSTDSKYDGRYKVAALVGENRVVIGRYSTKEKMQNGDFNAYGLLHHEFAV